ncbi:MAG: hypothetical protein J5544_00360 [Clostridia bacterium]|nr:hypothetical protein [Clostridia bacterium]
MKRIILISLAVILLLTLVSCAKENAAQPTAGPNAGAPAVPGVTAAPEETLPPDTADVLYVYNPETEVDNRYANAFCQIVELDNMFLWQYDSPICFYDKVTDYGDVFCSKPECDHSPDTEGCNGGIAAKPAINYYEGKFYFLASSPSMKEHKWYVFSMNTDSTGRETFMTVPWYEDGSMTLMRMFIHRGKMYFVNQYQFVENGKPRDRYSLLSCDFETHNADELRPVIEFDSSGFLISSLFFKGNEIYLMTTPCTAGQYYLRIWKYDTLTDETAIVVDMEIDDYFTPNDLWVMQNGDMLIGEGAVLPDQNVKMYKIVDNALEVYMEFEEAETPWWDSYVNEETVTATRVVSESPRQDEVWIRDHEGNTIFKGILPTQYSDGLTNCRFGGRTYFGASRDRILLSVEFNEEKGGTTKSERCFFIEYDITENGLAEKTLASYELTLAG